jgi:two-component system cell cycle response regulator
MAQETPSGFALMFVAGQYRGGELPLPEGREVVLGRDESAELRMVEDGVSRIHAKVVASRGGVVVKDLSSTNGTYVNGARITQQELRTGDKVLLGRSILQVIEDRGWQT